MVGLQDSLVLYQKASSAEVNWAKSEALQVRQHPVCLQVCIGREYNALGEKIKVLGVFLGTEDY